MTERLIKFRAWDKQAKQWVSEHTYLGDDGWHFDRIADDHNLNTEIQLSTGLLDKNGNEIFEGDLLRVKYPILDPKDGYYVDGIHRVYLSITRGLRLGYMKICDANPKNQYPPSSSLSFEYGTLDFDHRNQNYDRLAVLDKHTEAHGERWQVNYYSNDVEIVGNINEQENSNVENKG